mmetsp:Transcript_120065/g.233876  ORF Transcript_120065/g.233876 Transcript_120065/m.233876 type:complete len:96 (+) Transcript_120065:528-815(+)
MRERPWLYIHSKTGGYQKRSCLQGPRRSTGGHNHLPASMVALGAAALWSTTLSGRNPDALGGCRCFNMQAAGHGSCVQQLEDKTTKILIVGQQPA